MEIERFIWWAALAACWWYSWKVNQRARQPRVCACNEEGSRILASLVMKIDQARTFVGKGDAVSVNATRHFTCQGRRFKLTAVETENEPAE